MAKAKYGNQPTVADGLSFDSNAEARRYQELRLLLLAGEITDLVVHPRFALYAPLLSDGVVQGDERPPATLQLCTGEYGGNCLARRVGYYSADFAYVRRDGTPVVEDVKQPATRTAVYRLKKKMVEATYGLQVVEVAA